MTSAKQIENAPKRLQPMHAPGSLNKCRRLAWRMTEATLYRWSPVAMGAWRRMLLRLFGATVGAAAQPYPSARIWAPWNLEMGVGSCLGPRVTCYSVKPIRIGEGAVISQGAHLCSATHDYRDASFQLMGGAIEIGQRTWVAADAFIGPGVIVGDNAVVGARSVVVRDVPADTVVAGNPAGAIACRPRTDT